MFCEISAVFKLISQGVQYTGFGILGSVTSFGVDSLTPVKLNSVLGKTFFDATEGAAGVETQT